MPTTASPRRFIIVDDSTIQEKRDRQEERRPRKRQRVESDDEGGGGEVHRTPTPRKKRTGGSGSSSLPTPPFSYPDPKCLTESTEPSERDTVYWKEDPTAICFVRIKNTIFKIHAELLSASDVMQSCLEDHENAKGPTSEIRPLSLVTPSVDEFRAFLWALYASPEELSQPPDTDAQLERLFRIAAMTYKYDTPKLSDWIVIAIRNAASSAALMDSCSSATLSQFVDVAVYHRYDTALKLIVKKWCERLVGKSAPSVPAIQVADRHENVLNLRALRGVAYYVHVQDMHDRQTEYTESGATQLRSDPKLNNGQVMRLLGGNWSLVSLWERLRLKPAELPLGASCSEDTHAKCCSSWERRWISAAGWKRIIGHNSADVLALLSCLKDQLTNDDDLRSGLNPDCRRGGLDEIRNLREKIEAGLADHFTGVL